MPDKIIHAVNRLFSDVRPHNGPERWKRNECRDCVESAMREVAPPACFEPDFAAVVAERDAARAEVDRLRGR